MIFLSGASGFIGSHTLEELLKNKYKVRISLRKGSNTDNIKKFLDKVEVFYGDLSDRYFAEECVKDSEYVIHIAGKVDTSVSSSKREEIILSNYLTTNNIFSSALKAKVKKVVFLGSIFGLGKSKNKTPADENVEFNLYHLAKKIPYIRAKRMSEIMADDFLEMGLPIVRVYPNFCIGKGDIYLSSSKAILPFLNGVNIYFEGGINLQWVGDAAKALVLALEKGKEGEKYLVGGENLTSEEIFEKVMKITGKEAKGRKISPSVFKIFFYLPQPILDIAERMLKRKIKLDIGSLMILTEKYWFYSDEKARRELGYTSRPIDETISEAVNWLKEFLKTKKEKGKNPNLRREDETH